MPGKKWCQYCRINIPFNKKDIQAHEETRMHLQNKQKAIKFQRIKIQQQDKQKRQQQKQNALLSTANVPKAKKGSQLQQQVQSYRNDVMASGKAAIHQLIAQKTKGLYGAPIDFGEKQDLVLAQNYKVDKDDQSGSDSQKFEMWKIDICQQTGNPCFINRITQVKFYEPPKGHVMSQKQKEEWQYLKDLCKQKVDPNAQNTVFVSAWEEVPEEQDYFKINQIEQQEQEIKQQEIKTKKPNQNIAYSVKTEVKQEDNNNVQKSWVNQLQQKINNNSVDANQVMQTVIYNKLKLCKNIKQKNETLKILIKGDIQIRQTLDEENKQFRRLQGQEVKQENIGFKPRKKVKKVNISEEKDMY